MTPRQYSTTIIRPYNKSTAYAAIKARNDALEIELNEIPDEERQRIVDANYRGAD